MERRRTAVWLGGSIAVAVVVAVVVAVAGSGKSSPSPAEAELIARADRICAHSRKAFEEAQAKFPKGDRSSIFALIGYAAAVLEVSTSATEQLAALRPPDSVRDVYEKYVEVEQRIYYEDLTAVHAAHSAHNKEYLAVRKRQRVEQQEGYELAREIGLEECASQ